MPSNADQAGLVVMGEEHQHRAEMAPFLMTCNSCRCATMSPPHDGVPTVAAVPTFVHMTMHSESYLNAAGSNWQC